MNDLKGHIKVIKLNAKLMIDTSGKVEPSLQEKTVIPTAAEQVIEPDKGFDGLEKVTVVGDENFIAKNIKNGVIIWGIEGTSAAPPFVGKAVGYLPIIYRGSAVNDFNISLTFSSTAIGSIYEEV